TLTFDEIDAGVGGAVATQVGDRLCEVAEGRQVLVVTHLPQIACRAGHHLFVRKAVRGGLTATTVAVMDGEDRVREVARMLDGDPASEASLGHARELLGGRQALDRAG
ncbi:MAG: DNA repair protein RecN, partial [Longimicrobiales bacterium]